MTYKRVITSYEHFKKIGKLPRFIDYYSSFKNETNYIYFLKPEYINPQIPVKQLYRLCSAYNYVFGSSFCISIPLFLITLDQSFITKFRNFLKDTVYKELIKYQQKTSIGGIACLHHLYTPSDEPIKYMMLLDKEKDSIQIRVYSTLMLTFFQNESSFGLFKEKICDLIYTKAIFLEENDEKQIKIDFYKKLKYNWKTDSILVIQYFNTSAYYPIQMWHPMRAFFNVYIQDLYKIETSKIDEYLYVMLNNKFFTKWGISMNPRLFLLSSFQDETLEEVHEIYVNLGVVSRLMMNEEFSRLGKEAWIYDTILNTNKPSYCEKIEFNPCYDHYFYHDDYVFLTDLELSKISDSEVVDYFDLIRYNNYGDITGSIYPDYKKDRSISFLSSLRSINMVDAKALNYCVRPSNKIKVLESDVYDDLQMRIPMYEASIRKKLEFRYSRTGNINIDSEFENLNKKYNNNDI